MRGQPHDDQENYAYLITVPEETKEEFTALLDDIGQTRREIYQNHGPDVSDIYACYRDELSRGNIEEEDKQVTLGITEQKIGEKTHNSSTWLMSELVTRRC